MPEDKNDQVEMTKPDVPEQSTSVTPVDLQAELEAARKALKEANREAAERRKKLEAYEADEAKRKSAEMTEAEKLQKELELATSELKALKLNEMRRKIAAKHSIPEALAARLHGETEEELDEDAKALLEALPKPPKPQPGAVANPGANAQAAETDAQKRARLFGSTVDIFTPEGAKTLGGGWIINE